MSSDLHLGWVWTLSVTAILAGALTLYTARSAIGPVLDLWLPVTERPPEVVPSAEPQALIEPEKSLEEPVEPEWSYVDVEDAVRPLPESTSALIAAGRDEMSQFAGLGSTDETRALLIGNRWRMWGRVWHNRVEHIRRPMPPPEACDVHAALEPTCRAIRESHALLDRVPAAESVREAEGLLTEASKVLDDLRRQQEEAANGVPAESTPSGSGVP